MHKKQNSIKLLRRRTSKPLGSRGCRHKCFFTCCDSTCPKDNVNRHRVPAEPKNPPKSNRCEQWKNYLIKLRTIYIIKDRLGSKSKNIAYPKWYRLYENATPLNSEVKFEFNNK